MIQRKYSFRLIVSFKQFLVQIAKDSMLFLACFAPVLCGFIFRFGVPLAEELLIKQFHITEILLPYYQLFDLFLAFVAPLMFCFASSMVILGEIDEGISIYLVVTPLGKTGYIISRLGFSIVLSIFITIVILSIFSLTNLSFAMIVIISILSSFIALIEAMMIVSLSTNKVEGMAVAKLSGLFAIGMPVPYFIKGNIQYVLTLLPSFWLTKFVIEHRLFFLLFFTVTTIAWILFLLKSFMKKIK